MRGQGFVPTTDSCFDVRYLYMYLDTSTENARCCRTAPKLAFYYGVGNASYTADALHSYVDDAGGQARAAFDALAASLKAAGYAGKPGDGTSSFYPAIPPRMRLPPPGLRCSAGMWVGPQGTLVRGDCAEFRRGGTTYLLTLDGASVEGLPESGTLSVALELLTPSLGVCAEGL